MSLYGEYIDALERRIADLEIENAKLRSKTAEQSKTIKDLGVSLCQR